ncbi:MAG: hypothetical protein JW715_04715 [Sedimentisphaerales bacterium]|nr:hypothetical protein [Sedimentisphaerales bacterium]
MQERVKLSTGFFLGSFIGGFTLFILLYILGFVAIAATEEPLPGVLFFLVAILALIYAVVIGAVFVYKMWKAIQDGYARTTPGKACGFLFIPFFNLYWIFQAYWGFAEDYNAYIERHSVSTSKLPSGLFLTYAILHVASAVPYIGILPGIGAFVIYIILVVQICKAVNALPELAPSEQPPVFSAGQM